MANESNSGKLSHKNNEKTVRCPVEGCEEEKLARGIHLHVMRSVGDGHGTQNEIPEGIDLNNVEEVGSQEVEMEYPEERSTEQVARLCPYCERPFRGKHGVMIHLAHVAGRKNHPENGPDRHEPDDFSIVEVDDNENVVDVVEEGTQLPATERRQEKETPTDEQTVRQHIKELREQGLDKQADRAEKMLLGE